MSKISDSIRASRTKDEYKCSYTFPIIRFSNWLMEICSKWISKSSDSLSPRKWHVTNLRLPFAFYCSDFHAQKCSCINDTPFFWRSDEPQTLLQTAKESITTIGGSACRGLCLQCISKVSLKSHQWHYVSDMMGHRSKNSPCNFRCAILHCALHCTVPECAAISPVKSA